MSTPEQILDFWFGSPDAPGYGGFREAWFRSSEEFDREVRERFLSDYEAAAAGQLDHWKEEPRSCLALLILLDQFPRNLFREGERAFATDEKAVTIAGYAVDHGYDQQLTPIQRWFVYLPFEHSENLDNQIRSVQLFSALGPGHEIGLDYAERHRRVIQRFGRFPHRNADLGRESTLEELAFLQSPEAPF